MTWLPRPLVAGVGAAWLALSLLLATSCKKPSAKVESKGPFPLVEQRARLGTRVFAPAQSDPAPVPPPELFERVSYRAPLGDNVAYVTPRKNGQPGPAIVWIAGGMDWGIGESAWAPAPRRNDQSARAFGEAGILLMLPALRGSNGNPGRNECFLGEVDDILAAASYLASRPDVDPKRIYLGGHSTGGTMVLLVAASSPRFRAVFAFGPVADPRHYGDSGCLPSDISDREAEPRAPILFLNDIRTPTLVIEGKQEGNTDSIDELRKVLDRAPVEFHLVPGANHFNVLAPATEALAQQILADTGPTPRIKLDVNAISRLVVSD